MHTITTEDHPDLPAAVAAYCQREFGSRQVRDRLTDGGQEVHNAKIAAQMAAEGWLGITIPPSYGGCGGGYAKLCGFLRAASRGLAPVGAYPSSIIVGFAYLKYGSQAQKERVLPGIAGGGVAALALSEPDSGSDLSGLATRATPDDGGFILDGHKTWVSNAHLADHILVLARTDPTSSGTDGLTMLQVPAHTEGLSIHGIDTLAGRELNEVRFDSCRVPSSAVVGVAGSGWLQTMATLTFERIVVAAVTLGSAERTFDDVLRYVRERRQFGTPIGSFQALRHRLAELATDLECCRLLVGSIATGADERGGRLLPRETAMAKLRCSETAKRMAVEGMQMMGAYGTTVDSDMQRQLRAALCGTIMGGTSEIQREIVGRSLGL